MKLSAKILTATLIPFLIIFGLYHFLSTSAFSQYLTNIFHHQAHNKLLQAEADIRSYFSSRVAQLNLLVDLTPPDESTPQDSHLHFRSLLLNEESLFRISALKLNSTEWLRTNKFLSTEEEELQNYFYDDFYQKIMLDSAPYWCGVKKQEDYELPFLDIAIPVKDKSTGKVSGFVLADFSFQALQSLLERYIPDQGKIVLVNAENNEHLSQASDIYEDYSSLENQTINDALQSNKVHGWFEKGIGSSKKITFTFRRFEFSGLNLLLLYYQPNTAIYFLSNWLKANNIYVVLIGVVLFVIVNFFFIHLITKPLTALTFTISQLRNKYKSSEFEGHNTTESSNKDEVKQLKNTFALFEKQLASYSREIEHFNNTLEQQVAAKTEELNKANINLKKDIVRRKKIEQELDAHKLNLETIVELRTLELINTNKELQKQIEISKKADGASRAKSQFLANVSHEIRTPMNAILGMNRLALQTDLSKDQQKYLTVIQESAESLLNIINDILDFSKIEAGQLSLEEKPFDLKETLQFIENSFSFKAKDKGISLRCELASDIPTNLSGDENRLKQILINLTGNAIKFTEKGSVKISIQDFQEKEDHILFTFSVTDTGPGIPDEVKEHIFDNFTQADSSISRRYGGTGLGLAISKKITELLGGKIWFKSQVGVGSQFFFTSTFNKNTTQISNKQYAKNRDILSTTGLNILLVEDNKFNRDLGRIVLEGKGCVVSEAQNGIEALYQLSKKSFDAVLMDVQMPRMDGIAATKIIRQCEEHQNITPSKQIESFIKELHNKVHGHHLPIIAMTANAMSGDREKCIDAGMDEYITKPFIPEEVLAALEVFHPASQSSLLESNG